MSNVKCSLIKVISWSICKLIHQLLYKYLIYSYFTGMLQKRIINDLLKSQLNAF